MHSLIELVLFFSKLVMILLFFTALIAILLAFSGKKKDKTKGCVIVKNLNKQYDEMKEAILSETLTKKEFKAYLKNKKEKDKKNEKTDKIKKTIFVLQCQGDIKASFITELSEVISAILNIAKKDDEVLLRLESPGGIVHAYGLAASQLMRLRDKNIPLTVSIDKVAASGGYLMACIANKILSAPFAMVGSIGVLMQLPNFHRWLENKKIDFVQLTSGEYKRNLSLFGENTKQGEEKAKEELEMIHQLFKKVIQTYRPMVDIQKVATGEVWPGERALDFHLVDAIKTSDDYLLEHVESARLFQIDYEMKQSFLKKWLNF